MHLRLCEDRPQDTGAPHGHRTLALTLTPTLIPNPNPNPNPNPIPTPTLTYSYPCPNQELFKAIDAAAEQHQRRVGTSVMNEVLEDKP